VGTEKQGQTGVEYSEDGIQKNYTEPNILKGSGRDAGSEVDKGRGGNLGNSDRGDGLVEYNGWEMWYIINNRN